MPLDSEESRVCFQYNLLTHGLYHHQLHILEVYCHSDMIYLLLSKKKLFKTTFFLSIAFIMHSIEKRSIML